MLEAASAYELQRLEHPASYRCTHCGQDRRDRRYSWRNGITLVYGCCHDSLVANHSADRNAIVAQRTDHGLFGGRIKPQPPAALLTPPR